MGSGRGTTKRVQALGDNINKEVAVNSDDAIDAQIEQMRSHNNSVLNSFLNENDAPFGSSYMHMMYNKDENGNYFCTNKPCGKEVKDTDTECPHCGHRLDGPELFEQTFESFAKTADELGVMIPKKDPFYFQSETDSDIPSQLSSNKHILHTAMANGARAFTIYGPPGTGKNTFIRQVFASTTGMPVLEIDLSSSDELEALIGYDGLETDDNGGTKTVQKKGKLTNLAERGGVIVLNEITEAPRGQLTQIHNMIGSDVGGDGDDRYIVIKSSSADKEDTVIKVHPDTVFFFTYNPERSDRRPHEALLSRTVNMELGHGTEEQEQAILSKRVSAILANNKEWVRAREEAGLDLEVKTDEVKPSVGFFRKLRIAYQEDEIQHEPDMRTMAMFEATRLLQSTRPDNAAVQLALHQLDFMWDQTVDPADRRAGLERYATTHFVELTEGGTDASQYATPK